jgi:hypothetical protein
MDRTQSRRVAVTHRPKRIDSLLIEARRTRRRTAVTASALRWLGVVVAGLLTAIALDAVLGLPVGGLIVLDVALLALGVAAIARIVHIARRPSSDDAIARDLERAAGLERSELINSLHLARSGGGGSAALRSAAVQLGEESAATVSPKLLVDRPALRRGVKLAGIATAIAIGGVFLPGVYSAVVPRLLAPTADLPPFTLLRFDAKITPEPVIYGQSANVRVVIDSPTRPPQRVELELDPAGQHPAHTLRMLRVYTPEQAGRAGHRAAFTVQFARPEGDRTFYIDTPEGRSRRYRLEVLLIPRLQHAEVTYSYPTYTGWPSDEQPLDDRGLRGIVGTTAKITLRCSLPLENATFAFLPESQDTPTRDETSASSTPLASPSSPSPSTTPLVVSEEDPTRATLQWSITKSGRFRIDLVGIDGTPSDQPLEGRITAVPDEAPRITTREPAPRVIAPVDWVVDASFLATDDVGLAGVTLRRSINDSHPTARDLELVPTDPTGRRAIARDRFDFAAMGVGEGDVITFAALVRDNRPGSPQTDETELMTIEVISTERYLELQRMQYRITDMQAEWERFRERLDDLASTRQAWLEEMEELLAKVASGRELTAAERLRMLELSEQLGDYRNTALDLAEELHRRTEQATLYEFENPYKEMLGRVSQELEAQAQYAGELQRRAAPFHPGQAPPSAAQQRRMLDASQAFAERTEPFTREQRDAWQQAEADLDKLRLADAMRAAGERIRQVAAEQKNLANRLGAMRLREERTPMEALRADQLAQRQTALREELDAALTDLRQAAEEAQPHLPQMIGGAKKICELAERMNITRDQADAARFARDGAGSQAFDAADAAARKLDSLLVDASRMADPQNAPGLDGTFALPRDRLDRALQQMAQSRGIPGPPGLERNRPGASGYSMQGAAERVTLLGPAPHTQADRNAQTGTPGFGNGPGPGRSAAAGDQLGNAQTINPDSVRTHTGRISLIPGVPPEYREEAEAYFRRLADDSSP